MAVLFEAIVCAPSAADRKLADIIAKQHRALLASLGGTGDRPGQLAQLIALEYLVTGGRDGLW